MSKLWPVLHAGEDAITVTWSLNATAAAPGADAGYRAVKLLYAVMQTIGDQNILLWASPKWIVGYLKISGAEWFLDLPSMAATIGGQWKRRERPRQRGPPPPTCCWPWEP
uniref:Uncharacterized protein n=1 Tax=Oryza brachyantha TaxID=4533 RepID=J3LYX7_ORYBR